MEETISAQTEERVFTIQVRDLSVNYKTYRGEIHALNHINLDIRPSEIVAVVGESGCGKSTLGLALIGLLPSPSSRVASGEIIFDNKDLLKLTRAEMTKVRGTGISMIFQDPSSSLNPLYSVGDHLREAQKVKRKRSLSKYSEKEPAGRSAFAIPNLSQGYQGDTVEPSKKDGESKEIVGALKSVQISDPERVVGRYAHELSGGMAQRVCIAEALIEKPRVLIADEPTSALDVTTQSQVLNLMRKLRDDIHSSILFITHDLAVAAQIADRAIVMYAGEIIEDAPIDDIFREPLHPYTEGLMRSFPNIYKGEGNLATIGGDVPSLRNPPAGCKFHPRCPYAFARCAQEEPQLVNVSPKRKVSCFLREGE